MTRVPRRVSKISEPTPGIIASCRSKFGRPHVGCGNFTNSVNEPTAIMTSRPGDTNNKFLILAATSDREQPKTHNFPLDYRYIQYTAILRISGKRTSLIIRE